MSDGDNAPVGYLQGQIKKMQSERIRLLAENDKAWAAINEDEKRLAGIGEDLQQVVQVDVATEKSARYDRAWKSSLWPALWFKAIGGKWGRVVFGVWTLYAVFGLSVDRQSFWTALKYLGPGGAFGQVVWWRWLFALILVGVPYVFLVWIGRKKITKATVASDWAALDEYATLAPSLLAIGPNESHNPDFPYRAFFFPGIGTSTNDDYNIGKGHGPQFGASFLALRQGADMVLLSRFARDGFDAHTIPFGQLAADDPRLPLWAAMAGRRAEASVEHAPAILEYARKGEDVLGRQGQIQYLERRIETLQNIERDWTGVALPQATLDGVLKLVDAFAANRAPTPRGLLLYGPPGTGKTLIARKLAKNAGCNFVAANVSDLKAAAIGGTGKAVKAIWADARKKAPTILFVDECESVFAARGSTHSDSFGADLVNTFLSEWDGFDQAAGKVFVIGATNRHDLIDNAVLSRFTESIEIGPPDAAGRRTILNTEFAKARLQFEATDQWVRDTSGMSGRDLSTLVAKIAANAIGETLTQEEFALALKKARGKGSTTVQPLTWDDLILPDTLKREFQSLGRELVHAEDMRKLGVQVPRGILLYGPPGTGKTQIARVLASEAGLSFLAAASSDLKAGYIGQSGGNVKQLFDKARAQAPCILFLDELDAVAKQRGGGDPFTEEIVAQLLQELDGVATKNGQVFLLAASNHPDHIDAALRSRLERKILIDLPDVTARAAILRLQLTGKPLAFEVDAACTHLATLTEGRSGRDLQSLVTTATRAAVQRAMAETGDPRDLKLTLADLESAV
ncbi:MAG: ATP-binding protein [Pseudomonas sp.]